MNSNELKKFVSQDRYPNCEHIMVYKGVRCSQTPRVLDALDSLHDKIWNNSPGIIIEIGTLYGAFTQILRDHDISWRSEIHTFDVINTVANQPKNVNFHIGSVFIEQFNNIVDLIKNNKTRTLVFCDGGNKEEEVNILCRYMKTNDIILCHDYVKYPEDINNPEIVGNWRGYESQYSNIEHALQENNFAPFNEDEMRRAMWGCFIKC